MNGSFINQQSPTVSVQYVMYSVKMTTPMFYDIVLNIFEFCDDITLKFVIV